MNYYTVKCVDSLCHIYMSRCTEQCTSTDVNKYGRTLSWLYNGQNGCAVYSFKRTGSNIVNIQQQSLYYMTELFFTDYYT